MFMNFFLLKPTQNLKSPFTTPYPKNLSKETSTSEENGKQLRPSAVLYIDCNIPFNWRSHLEEILLESGLCPSGQV